MTHLAQDDDHAICARCGKKLRPLEEIYVSLAMAPYESQKAGQASGSFAVALAHFSRIIGQSVRDLACHAGTCYEGML